MPRMDMETGWENWGGIKVRLDFLPIESLSIDDEYQRLVVQSRVNKWARDFCPHAFQCLLIGRRTDGSHWVVDGSHRRLVAMLAGRPVKDGGRAVKELDRVPCFVFPSRGRAHEAEIFVRVNKDRTRVDPIASHKASVCYGAETAVAVDAILAAHGFRVAKGGWGAISAVRRVYEAYDLEILDDVMEIIVDAFEEQSTEMRKLGRESYMLGMVTYIIHRWGRGDSIQHVDRTRLVTVLQRLTKEEWKGYSSHGRGPAGRSRSGEVARAFILRKYNFRLAEENRIDPDKMTAEEEQLDQDVE